MKTIEELEQEIERLKALLDQIWDVAAHTTDQGNALSEIRILAGEL